MILVIDVGNSNLVLGVFRQLARIPEKTWRLSTHPIGTGDDLRTRIQSLFIQEGYQPQNFEDVVVCSVVPAVTALLREVFPRVLVMDHAWPFSFRIGTEPPSRTGMDRLVNAEAALRDYGAPAIIVDAGTTTTICALSSERVFLGGAILPGIEASRDSLALGAAQLFPVELQAPARAIGPDTDSALRSGIVLGYASMIDGMVRRFKRELQATGPAPRVIATGGISPLLRGLCNELDPQAFDPELTLRGILYLYESFRNR